MSRTLITILLIVALVIGPVYEARAVIGEILIAAGVIGIILDVITLTQWITNKSDDGLYNTQGALSSQLIDEVGDVTYYTVSTDAAVDSFYSRKVKAILHVSNGLTASKWSGTFTSQNHVEFKFKVEARETGLDNVYADVELWKNTPFGGGWVYITGTSTSPVYFDIKHAYTLKDPEISPDTNVRHNESFSCKLKAVVKTPKAGSYSGENVQNEFGPTTVTGANPATSSYTTTLNTFSSKHADMPWGIVIGEDAPVLSLLLGEEVSWALAGPGGASAGQKSLAVAHWEIDFDHTPPHLLPQEFYLGPLKAKFKITKDKFESGRNSDYAE